MSSVVVTDLKKEKSLAHEILVAPSILSADFANLEKEIQAVLTAGADWIHVDVMDGHFVPNLTMGAPVVSSLRKITKAPLDVHLMIEQPEKYVEDFAKAGADYLTIHVESTKDPKAVLQNIRSYKMKPGITLKPPTKIEEILPLLPFVDLVLIMTVNPGFSGQKFLEDQVAKIKVVSEALKKLNKNIPIEVDGGVNEVTSKICTQAGASVFVAGNYVFKNDYKKAIQSLKGTL